MTQLSIIIPAYNERLRLPATFRDIEQALLAQRLPASLEVIVVNDGSSDGTGDWLIRQGTAYGFPVRVVSLDAHQGKGAAVKGGMRLAQGDWVLITDADASTPFEEYQTLREAGTEVAIASRALPASQILIRQPGCRHWLGQMFNWVVRSLSGLPFRDTQCGFKLLSRSAVQAVWSQLTVKHYAWDVELLMLLERRGVRITEVPVRWEHRENSRVRLAQDGIRMLLTVVSLRWRLGKRGGCSLDTSVTGC